ncbi:putative conserved secreted protein [Synechococcus sp. MIT S9220]|nr:putative conserved secreted protein [Synechococcus sp. MIT S9220]
MNKFSAFFCIGALFVLINMDANRSGYAQNESWIKKDILLSCLQQAKKEGISWNYLAYVQNGRAHLLTERVRGGDVFMCEVNGNHASPDYN